VFPVSGDSDLLNFSHLFTERTKKDLADDHLWISVSSLDFGEGPKPGIKSHCSSCFVLLDITLCYNYIVWDCSDEFTQ